MGGFPIVVDEVLLNHCGNVSVREASQHLDLLHYLLLRHPSPHLYPELLLPYVHLDFEENRLIFDRVLFAFTVSLLDLELLPGTLGKDGLGDTFLVLPLHELFHAGYVGSITFGPSIGIVWDRVSSEHSSLEQ